MDPVIGIIVVLVVLVLLGAAVYFLVRRERKWRCVEGNCALVFGGEYDTKEECVQSCKAPEQEEEPETQSPVYEYPLTYPYPVYIGSPYYWGYWRRPPFRPLRPPRPPFPPRPPGPPIKPIGPPRPPSPPIRPIGPGGGGIRPIGPGGGMRPIRR